MTLAGAGIQSGAVITVAWQLQTTEVWHLQEWETSWRGGAELKLMTASVPQASAAAIVQQVANGLGQLLQVGFEHMCVYDPADDVSAAHHGLEVTGAGSPHVNGFYIRDGAHFGSPRWRRFGYVIPAQRCESIWFRKGSDGKWCIVDSAGGTAMSKKIFQGWYSKRERNSGDPSEMLFQHIYQHGSAFVVVPQFRPDQRPVAMHVQHYKLQTLLFVKNGYVGCESFDGMSDEQISIWDGNVEFGPAVFQYLGQ